MRNNVVRAHVKSLTLISTFLVTLTGVFCNVSAASLDTNNEVANASQLTRPKSNIEISTQPAVNKARRIQPLYSGQFESALLELASLRLNYQEYWVSFGQQPESLNDIGLSENDYQSELIEHVGISTETGAILIGLDDVFGDKQWAALIPEFEQNQLIRWRCQTTLSQAAGDAVDCRYDMAYNYVDRLFDPVIVWDSLTAMSSLRAQYTEFYQTNGSVPTKMKDLGVEPNILNSGHISHVMVDPNTKAMFAGLDDAVYGLNQWISVTPIINRYGNITRWGCRTTLPNQLLIEAGVRGCAADRGVEDMLYSILAR